MSRTCTDWQEISCPRMGVNFTRNDFGCFAYRENQRGYKPSIVNCTLLIVNFTLFWAFRLSPSGFPLYLFPLRSKRMPLQSLTHSGCHKTNASLGLDTDLIRRSDIVIYNHPISIFICSCTFSNLSISVSHSGKSLFIHSNTSSNSS